jgi:fructose-1-phosphate kinase PfkB-like protein
MIYTVTLNPAVDRELTVPSIEMDTVLRASELRVDIGGKGFNVSRMVQQLGGESVALGFVGGNAGRLLADGLQEHGVACGTVAASLEGTAFGDRAAVDRLLGQITIQWLRDQPSAT